MSHTVKYSWNTRWAGTIARCIAIEYVLTEAVVAYTSSTDFRDSLRLGEKHGKTVGLKSHRAQYMGGCGWLENWTAHEATPCAFSQISPISYRRRSTYYLHRGLIINTSGLIGYSLYRRLYHDLVQYWISTLNKRLHTRPMQIVIYTLLNVDYK